MRIISDVDQAERSFMKITTAVEIHEKISAILMNKSIKTELANDDAILLLGIQFIQRM